MNELKRTWQGAELIESHMVAENVMSLSFKPDNLFPFKAGQHLDIQLTAPNGYKAERSYSIANAPEKNDHIELGVQLLEGGEVSPYLFTLKSGEKIEMRGPIGGHFIWDVSMPGPLYLIGGGSGMVPLMSMLRHHMEHLDAVNKREIIFFISARNIGRVLYKDELEEIVRKDSRVKVVSTLTEVGATWQFAQYSRRIDESMFSEVFKEGVSAMPMIYICGPTPFVEVASKLLLSVGYNPHEIRTERFGG